MRKFLLITICIFCTLPVFAEPQQTVTNEQSYGIVNIEKAPASENKQSIKNTRSWFCINIIFNGKIKNNNTSVQSAK